MTDLTKLYHLEQYPDSYDSMCEWASYSGACGCSGVVSLNFSKSVLFPTAEPPVAHLVHHMLPRAFAFPVDPQVQSAVDESAVQLSELLTLPVLMKRSLMAPLAAQ